MKLVHVRPITLSCMAEFENNLVQMIIMTKQFAMNNNHVIRFMSQSALKLCALSLPIAWSSMLGFINNVVQMTIMTRGCVANKHHVASLKFQVKNFS